MSYLNQPNRVYISNLDGGSRGQSGDFEVRLDNPIRDAKSVQVLSSEYPSSFYNVKSDDVLKFDEVYELNGVEQKRINFELTGIPDGSYTALTLVNALNAKLDGSVQLFGKDPNPEINSTLPNFRQGAIQDGNLIVSPDFTNETFQMSKLISSTDSRRYRIEKIYFYERNWVNDTDAYAFLIEADDSNNYSVLGSFHLYRHALESENTNKHYSYLNFRFEIDIAHTPIDTTAGKNYFLGFLFEENSNALAYPTKVAPLQEFGGTENAFVFRTDTDTTLITKLKTLINNSRNLIPANHLVLPRTTILDLHNRFFDTPEPITFAVNPTDQASTPQITAWFDAKFIFDYSYNNAKNYSRSKLNFSYDTINKRFSVIPALNPLLTQSDNTTLDTTATTIPFYRPPYKFQIIGNYGFSNWVGYLEIPTNNVDKDSLNYILGARDDELTSIKFTDKVNLSSPIRMPSIPYLVRNAYVYLTCDFINDSYTSGTPPNRSILQKLPLSNQYGDINYYNFASSEYECVVNRQEIQTLRFRLLNREGEVLDFSGGEISFTLAFRY